MEILRHQHDLLGHDVTALLHQTAHREPHGVDKGKLIDEDLLLVAGVGIVPLVGTEPGGTH